MIRKWAFALKYSIREVKKKQKKKKILEEFWTCWFLSVFLACTIVMSGELVFNTCYLLLCQLFSCNTICCLPCYWCVYCSIVFYKLILSQPIGTRDHILFLNKNKLSVQSKCLCWMFCFKCERYLVKPIFIYQLSCSAWGNVISKSHTFAILGIEW